MPGLVPGIHVFLLRHKTWMAGTSPGHDAESALVTMMSEYVAPGSADRAPHGSRRAKTRSSP